MRDHVQSIDEEWNQHCREGCLASVSGAYSYFGCVKD